jgi:hypothetical protein
MRRLGLALWIASCVALILPRTAAAGGNEFPAGGTRGLGRGGTGFTRADDPTIMARNPALLADLWDDSAMGGAHFLLVDSCFKATGGYGMGASGSDVFDLGDGTTFLQAEKGFTDLKGKPLKTFLGEPYPEVCFSGPMPILPTFALAKKLAPDLGVGIGFFPPDTGALSQWGNRDGTVDTAKGLRPSPTRYFRSHLNVSFLTVLGAVGYRLSDLIRIGAALQWNAVAFEATTWSRPTPDLAIRNDVRVDAFGRDLFIPGIIGSVHIVPHENLDLAIGFKWSDRIKTKAKLDLTTGAFGTGEGFFYLDKSGQMQAKSGTVPTTAHNQQGSVSSPPIWAPQLTLGGRYAQRLKPRVTGSHWEAAHLSAGREVQDSMATERWDVEANGVVYFNSVNDEQVFTTDAGVNAAKVVLVEARPDGSRAPLPANIGSCTNYDAKAGQCVGQWRVPTVWKGKTQLSLRVGGDYNVLPGLLAVRAGASYESDGADVQYLDITNYMLGRIGLHSGVTVRIAGHTDLSLAFAHFFQPDVRLDPNPVARLLPKYQTAEYNYLPGKHDGIGKLEVPYGARTGNPNGPYFANVGSYHYTLSVASVTLAQHF